ncbi:hypothetical protein WDZ92_09265 [Nostoc sp. NIES-2111]
MLTGGKINERSHRGISNLVLALGNVIGYHHVDGAKENAFPFWTINSLPCTHR